MSLLSSFPSMIPGVKPSAPLTTPTTLRSAWLKGPAARIWKKYAPELHRIGVLKKTDCAMFAVGCSLMADFSADPGGFGAARLAQLRGLAKSFGLTPGARRGIRAEPPKNPDPAEKFFT